MRIITSIKNNKNLVSNFAYLVSMNFANFALPLMTFPYLVKVLGVENFGLIAFAAAIVNYFVIFTDYGFNITATRQIALNINNKSEINRIVSSVYIIKAILLFVSFLVLLTLLILVPKLQNNWEIYIYTFGLIIGQSLFPIWFFQGIERMKTVSILNLVSKIIFTIAIFLFVNKEADFYLVPIFSSLGYLLIGIYSSLLVIFKYNVTFGFQSFETIKYYLKEGWYIFLSNISVTLYTTVTVTILGFFTNNVIVGYYSIAEKVIGAIRGMMTPLSQIMFPYLSKKHLVSKDIVLSINKKILLIGIFPFMILTVIIFIYSNFILKLLFGIVNPESVIVLKVLSPIPFLIFIHTVYAMFTILVFGMNKDYSKIIVSAGIINIILVFILIPTFQHIGAAFCVLLIEMYIALRYIIFTYKNKISII